MSNSQLHKGMEIETDLVGYHQLQVGDHVVSDDLIHRITVADAGKRRGVPVWSLASSQAVTGREVEVPYADGSGVSRYRVITVVR